MAWIVDGHKAGGGRSSLGADDWAGDDGRTGGANGARLKPGTSAGGGSGQDQQGEEDEGGNQHELGTFNR